jgi:hypothetical protein
MKLKIIKANLEKLIFHTTNWILVFPLVMSMSNLLNFWKTLEKF